MSELRMRDWRCEVDSKIDLLIMSINTDCMYSAGNDCKYQVDKISEIYYDNVARWGFDLSSIICDLEDHDAELLEEAAEIIMNNCSIMANGSYEDIKFGVVDELAETYNVLTIDNSISSVEDIPYILSRELMINKRYYEIEYPPADSYQSYQTEARYKIGYNDCQNILFKDMVNFEVVYDTITDKTISIPIHIRPKVKNCVRIGGETNERIKDSGK